MLIRKFYIILFSEIFLLWYTSNSIHAQGRETISIIVKQQILPDGLKYSYQISNSKIKVFQITLHNHQILKYTKNLHRDNFDSIAYYVKLIFNQNINNEYYRPVLDGINWRFELGLDNKSKIVEISNCQLKIFNDLLKSMNNSLPSRKRFIRMDIFDSKNCE
jgi:hypothetical protein